MERRVDADDLVALARVLEVMPVELLQDRQHSLSLNHELALQRARRALGEMQALADEAVSAELTALGCAQTVSQEIAAMTLGATRKRIVRQLNEVDDEIGRTPKLPRPVGRDGEDG